MTGSPERVPRNLRVLLAANFISALGSGLTLPFLLIYLHDVRHISLGLTGLLIGGASVVSIPAGPATGVLVDRIGPRAVSATALALEGAGTLALVLVRSPLSALPVMLLYGLGNGSTFPSWSALFAVMTSEELRPRVFARNFQLLNLGLGCGSVAAGLFVSASRPSSFVLIYLLDGLTYGAVVLALLLLPAAGFARPARTAEDRPAHAKGGYREVLADRRFRRYMLVMGLMAFASYAAVNAGLVGYATVVMHCAPSVIAWAFAANTGLIVLAQPLALRVVERMRRTAALAACAALFGASWLVLAVGGLFPRSKTGDALVIAMFAVFAMGEVLLSPVGLPLVNVLARPSLEGRYNATASSTFTVANVVGPAVAGAMLGAGLGDAYLGLLVACAALSAAGCGWLRRSLSPELDNPGRWRGPPATGQGAVAGARTA